MFALRSEEYLHPAAIHYNYKSFMGAIRIVPLDGLCIVRICVKEKLICFRTAYRVQHQRQHSELNKCECGSTNGVWLLGG